MERLNIQIGPRYYQHAREIVRGAQARIKAAERERDRMKQSRDHWQLLAIQAEAKLKAINQAIGGIKP